MKSAAKIVCINIIVLAGLIAVLEICATSYVYLEKKVFSNRHQKEKADGIVRTRWKQVYHPGVGHSHQKSEFELNANSKNSLFDNIAVRDVYKPLGKVSGKSQILVLGGSTTDPIGTQFSGIHGTWVHHLFKELASTNRREYLVDNAGNGGSTSSNELTRMITQLHRTNYDIIIAFNGINEIYFSDSSYLGDPENVLASKMVVDSMGNHGVIKALNNQTFTVSPIPYLALLLRNSNAYQILAKTKKEGAFANANLSDSRLQPSEKKKLIYAANIWNKNVSFMNAVANQQGARYMAILQPTLGLDPGYCKNSSRECMLANRRYINKIRYLYSILRRFCSEKSYCYDLSKDSSLNNIEALYTDPRHPNSRGNKKIAQAIKRIM